MRIAVVGAGLAAAKAVEELRSGGHDGTITVLGAEPQLPYERPPLSKGLLLGTADEASAFVHDQDWYDEKGVDLRIDTTATDLDLDRGLIRVGEEEVGYDRLLIATGAGSRRLPTADAVEPLYLRTLEQSRAVHAAFGEGRHLVIVGAGWIGLEVAAAAREAGTEVTVIESLPLPLYRVLGPTLGTYFADLHRTHGVDLRLGSGVDAFDRRDDGRADVRLDDGSTVVADQVLVSIGAVPDDTLARRAGLAVDNGLLVDAQLRASDPHVFGAGDVANQLHPALGRLRVEHWDNAIEQGKVAARNMLGGDEPYDRQPYFFTDQYDMGTEYVGHATADDEVLLRGGTDEPFCAFWLRDDRVVAGMHVNDWDAISGIRAIVGSRVDPARLSDKAVPLS